MFISDINNLQLNVVLHSFLVNQFPDFRFIHFGPQYYTAEMNLLEQQSCILYYTITLTFSTVSSISRKLSSSAISFLSTPSFFTRSSECRLVEMVFEGSVSRKNTVIYKVLYKKNNEPVLYTILSPLFGCC